MIQEQIIEFEDNTELDREMTFEVSEEIKVTTKIKYKKGDVIDRLVCEINSLKSEIELIKDKKILATRESLVNLWDNEYDERWNKC